MIFRNQAIVLKGDGPDRLPGTLRAPPACTGDAYEHAFEDTEVQEWLDRQIKRYKDYGLGLWAVILKEYDEMIGQCGLTMQVCKDKEVRETGYLFGKAYWRRGYAIEVAAACREYAFRTLGATEVFSVIRDSNIPSQHVPERNGMTVREQLIKRCGYASSGVILSGAVNGRN